MNRDRFRRSSAPLSVETTGKSVDEAVQAALGRLRARRDEVDIDVVEEGRGGFFGLGAKEARVRVRRRGTGSEGRSGRPPGGRDDRESRGGRTERDDRRPEGRRSREDRDSRGTRDARDVRDSREGREGRDGRDGGSTRDDSGRGRTRSIPAVRAKEELDRLENELRVRRETRRNEGPRSRTPLGEPDRSGERASSRGSGESGDPRRRRRSRRPGGDGVNLETIGADPVEAAPVREEAFGAEPRPPADGSGRAGGGRGGERHRRGADERAVTVLRSSGLAGEEPSESVPAGPMPEDYPDPQELAGFARELLQRMGFKAQVEAGWGGDAYEVKIHAGESDEVLIGRRGETLDALQHVFAKMVSRGREELLRVRVDVSEYRQRRTSELEEHAMELARQVRETGREVITEPMPAAERRIIHRTLSDLPDVTTVGLGDGHEKPVWIGPAGKEPEERASRPRFREGRDDRRGPRGGRERQGSVREPAEVESRSDERVESAAGDRPGGLPPLSMIDSWDSAAPKPGATPEGSEWGRRPKPAKGRRR